MSIVGGLSAQVGIGEETTVGTAVTPTRFFELLSESMVFSRDRIESKGLRTGRRSVDKWVAGKQGGQGDLSLDTISADFGLLSKYLLGSVASAQPNVGSAPTVWQHTAKVGQLDGKSLTVQFGRTPVSGTTDAYTYSGVKITQWDMSVPAPDGLATLKLTLDAQKETTATGLASATFPTTSPLLAAVDANATVTIGGTAYPIKGFTLTGNNNLAAARYAIGSPYELEQLEGQALRDFTGTLDLESYQGLTPYNLFVNGTEAQVVATFTGTNIALTYNYSIQITLPRVRFDGTTPTVGGEGLIPHSIPMKALWTSAGTTEVQIVTTNTSTTP